MKVLSFSYCFPSSVNPTWGVFVLQRLAALARLVDLEVVSPVPVFPLWSRWRSGLPEPVEEMSGLTVHHPRFFYFPGVLKAQDGRFYARGIRRWLAEFCRRRRPDLLDAHFVWPDGVGVGRLAGRLGVPYVITLRGWIYPCLENRSMRRQCTEALRNAAAVISVSTPMAEVARELGVSPDRLHVIPNGVDTEMFRPGDKSSARRQLGLPDDGRLIVSVAHLGPRKGHSQTVRALLALPEDVRLVIVGSDAAAGKGERALRELINGLGLAERVILAGRQPYERVPLYFNAADVSVLASYREGCPNVVLESLAAGVPVVATRVGAVSEMLSTPDEGRIVPPRDADALAGAIGEVLESQWSSEALANADAVKSWNDVAGECHNVFVRVRNGYQGF